MQLIMQDIIMILYFLADMKNIPTLKIKSS